MKSGFTQGFINDMLTALFFQQMTREQNKPNVGKRNDIL
jgi:hypothetical protein